MRLERYARERCLQGQALIDFFMNVFEGKPFKVSVTKLPMTPEQIAVAQGRADAQTRMIARRQRHARDPVAPALSTVGALIARRGIVWAMPAHSIGSGTISFGLVSIPVKLYAATSPAGKASAN